MFGWEFPPHNSGGLGVACQGLARALAAKNVELTFVLPKKIGVNEPYFRFRFADVPNMTIAEVDSILAPYITSSGYRMTINGMEDVGMYGSTLFEEVKRYAALARSIARTERFDVVHSHDWLSFGAGISAKEVSSRPFVAHVHATEIDRAAGNPHPYIYEQERIGVSKADRIIAVSAYTKKILVDHYGAKDEKVDVVHNGIDKSCYNFNFEEPSGIAKLKQKGYGIVLFVGRITVMKGVDYLLRAAARVVAHKPKTIFVIAGSGDMENQIMREAAEFGISDKVVFPGFLRGKDLSDAYRSADLFVMPSVSEPFGLTGLESLIHGTPVLLSKQSGVSEVLSNALKSDFWDVEDMADKILSALEYSSMRSELIRNGAREADAYTWDRAAQKCLSVYDSLHLTH